MELNGIMLYLTRGHNKEPLLPLFSKRKTCRMERALLLNIISKFLDALQEGNWGTGQPECGGAPFSATNSDNRLGEGHHAITSLVPPLPPTGPSRHDEVTDISWSTHKPLGLPDSELVSTAELVRVIRRLWVAAAPSLDGISVLCLR